MQNLLNRLFGTTPAEPVPTLTPAQQEINDLLEAGATALEQGYNETALDTYQRGLEMARDEGDLLSVERFLSGIGAAHVAQRDYDAARAVFDEALELAQRLKDNRSLARCLNNIGSLYAQKNEWGQAQTYHQQALDAARTTGSTEVIALTLENLAKDYLSQDNPSYAQHLLQEAVILTQADQHTQIAARVLGLYAEATLAVGDRANGHRLLTQAVHFAQQTGQSKQQLHWLQALAALEMESRNYALAIDYYQAAENLALRLGDQSAEFFMNSALELSTAYQLSGNSAQAEEYATRALAQARSTGNATHEASALTRLGMAAYTMGDLSRARSFLTEALTYYDSGAIENHEGHIQILLTLGNIDLRQNKTKEGPSVAEKALELARKADDKTRQAEALHLLGNIAGESGERDQALSYWQQALDLFDNTNYIQIARLRCDIARLRKLSGDFKAALVEYEKALMLLNHINHPPTRGLVLSNAATLYTDMGDVDTAQAFYDESIAIAREMGDTRAESLRLGNLGWFYTLTGRPQSALGALEEALKLSHALDDTLMIAVQNNNLGRTYYLLKDYETARTLQKQAIAAATAVGDDRWLAFFQSDMGETMVALDRLDEAEALYRSALEKSERLEDYENLVRTQARLADLCVRNGQLDEADSLSEQSEATARKMAYRKGVADSLAARGALASARGDSDQAQRAYAEARRLYTILHDPAADRLAKLLPESASA